MLFFTLSLTYAAVSISRDSFSDRKCKYICFWVTNDRCLVQSNVNLHISVVCADCISLAAQVNIFCLDIIEIDYGYFPLPSNTLPFLFECQMVIIPLED